MKKLDWKRIGWIIKTTFVWAFLVSTGALIVILPLAFAPELIQLFSTKKLDLFPVIVIYAIIWGGAIISWGIGYGNQNYHPRSDGEK